MKPQAYRKLQRQRPDLKLPKLSHLTKAARRLVSRHSPNRLAAERAAVMLTTPEDDPWNKIQIAWYALFSQMLQDASPVFDEAIIKSTRIEDPWFSMLPKAEFPK